MKVISKNPHLQGSEMPPRKPRKKSVSDEEKAILLQEAKQRDYNMK
jgi:hypothetical protein